jgi:hypothetical protein
LIFSRSKSETPFSQPESVAAAICFRRIYHEAAREKINHFLRKFILFFVSLFVTLFHF